MNCANCGQPAGEADVFCASCGADLNAQRAVGAQQPTAVMPPQQPVAPPPPPPAAPPQQPPAPPQQPTAVMPPQQAQPTATMPPQQPYAQQPAGAYAAQPTAQQPAEQPPSKNKTALWIVLSVVIGLMLLCSCAGIGTWAYLYGPLKKKAVVEETVVPPSEDAESSEGETAPGAATSATPDEAIEAAVPEGWVVRKVNESPQQVEFWAGPPNSEFTTVYLVEPQADGGWLMTESYPLQQGGDVSSPEDEAKAVVEEFLTHIKADEPAKAQALTIDPFHSDAASAQYSNGEFVSFSVVKVESAGDDTYFVSTTEKWKSFTDKWTYRVVPTEEGMRISELMPTQ